MNGQREFRLMNRPEPGFWMVRCCRKCPEVAARIWLCDHEPGIPENKVDQPYLQGQIGLDLVDPVDIWHRRGRAIGAADYERQVAWLKWAERNQPTHPDFTYRRAANPATAPIPRFGVAR